jgi:Predicted periplasmic protein (DUF2092)
VNKQLFFDGKTITLYDKDDNVYGILEVPAEIESPLEKANKEFGGPGGAVSGAGEQVSPSSVLRSCQADQPRPDLLSEPPA